MSSRRRMRRVCRPRLPAEYFTRRSGPDLVARCPESYRGGIKLVQLRAAGPRYRDLAVDAVGLCAGKAQLMLKGPFEWLGIFLPPAGT
jgi:8-oxo-dGTP diphosphatase